MLSVESPRPCHPFHRSAFLFMTSKDVVPVQWPCGEESIRFLSLMPVTERFFCCCCFPEGSRSNSNCQVFVVPAGLPEYLSFASLSSVSICSGKKSPWIWKVSLWFKGMSCRDVLH